MPRAALLLLALALGGCADCTGLDWQARGYRDGFGGHPPQDMLLARQCGAQVLQDEYLKGWAVGHDEHERLKTMTDL